LTRHTICKGKKKTYSAATTGIKNMLLQYEEKHNTMASEK
jgi:hypothetical protein